MFGSKGVSTDEYLLLATWFNEDEIAYIKQKRKSFEELMNVEGIKEGLTYEDFLHKLIRKKVTEKTNKRYEKIKMLILKRCRYLYDFAWKKYSDNWELKLNYLEFLEEHNIMVKNKDHMYNEMIERFAKHENVWLTRAKLYQERAEKRQRDKQQTNKDLEFLISFLTTGSKKATTNHRINIELIHLIPQSRRWADHVHDFMTTIDEVLNNCSLIEVQKLLKFLQRYPKTADAQTLLFNKLIEFPSQADSYQFRAEYLLTKRSTLKSSGVSKFDEIKMTYENGLQIVKNDEKERLFDYYLRFLLEAENKFEINRAEHNHSLKNIFERASQHYCLPIKFFQIWSNLDLKTAEERMLIQEAATKYGLVSLEMKLAMKFDSKEKVLALFNEKTSSISIQDPDVWLDMFKFHMINSSDTEIHDFFNNAIAPENKLDQNIVDSLRYLYLNWLAMDNEVDMIRNAFKSLAVDENSLTMNLYLTMVAIENASIKPNFDEMRNLHERAVEKFGTSSITVWINYISMYMFYDSNNASVKRIYNRALGKLNSSLITEFNKEYDDLRNCKINF